VKPGAAPARITKVAPESAGIIHHCCGDVNAISKKNRKLRQPCAENAQPIYA
jgi:hypothetical protein